MRQRVIHLHPAAPAKPPRAQPCNGCGVCCAYAPCPLGMLISRRRSGACTALQWSQAERRYRCGALAATERPVRGLPRRWAAPLVRRWIAAGLGCDAALEAVAVPAVG